MPVCKKHMTKKKFICPDCFLIEEKIEKRQCSHCKKKLSIENFKKNKHDEYHAQCNHCLEWSKQYYQKKKNRTI